MYHQHKTPLLQTTSSTRGKPRMYRLIDEQIGTPEAFNTFTKCHGCLRRPLQELWLRNWHYDLNTMNIVDTTYCQHYSRNKYYGKLVSAYRESLVHDWNHDPRSPYRLSPGGGQPWDYSLPLQSSADTSSKALNQHSALAPSSSVSLHRYRIPRSDSYIALPPHEIIKYPTQLITSSHDDSTTWQESDTSHQRKRKGSNSPRL
jgi:hypothetical protein